MGARRRRAFGLAAGIAALVVAHGGALDNSFHYDDFHSIVENPHVRSLAAPAAFFAQPQTFSARSDRAMFRPLVVLSYALNYAAGDYDPTGYLVVNLAAHLTCMGLVWLLGAGLGLPPSVRWAAALLFAVHPVNAEVVNYVSARSESFAAAGGLGALAAWTSWRRRGDSARYAFGLGSLAAGLLSKATAIAMPAMLAIHEALSPRPRRFGATVPFVALALGYAAIVADPAGTALGEPVRPLATQLWTQLKALPYYAQLLVLPAHLTVEHDFAPAAAIGATALVAVAFALSLGALAWHRLESTGRGLAAWAILSLAPASAVPLNVLVNEHRLYVAVACLSLLLCSWFAGTALGRSRRLGVGIAAILAGTMAVLSHGRARVWDTELTLWSEAVDRSPYAFRAHLHLGGARESMGDVAGALASYREAARLAPERAETHYNLGNALRLAHQVVAARHEYERSLDLRPSFLDARLNLATLHQETGQLDEARHLLSQARQLAPESAEVWRRLGVLARAEGDTGRAEAAYRQALELDPNHAETCYNLANLLDERGLGAAAAGLYARALVAEPRHHRAANNLALLAMEAGDAVAAERICTDALRLSPGQSKLYYLLATAQEAQGKRLAALSSYRACIAAPDARADVREAVRQRIAQLEAGVR